MLPGDFKRNLGQNFGGRSSSREDFLKRLELERWLRENEKDRGKAIVTFQKTFRGMRQRKTWKIRLREQFIQEPTNGYPFEILERQIKRLNIFFDPSKEQDLYLLCDLSKAMLVDKEKLMVGMLQDQQSLLRTRLVLEKALTTLSEHNIFSRSRILQLIETFTDPNELEVAEKTSNKVTTRPELVLAIIWSHFVLEHNFFSRYLIFLRGPLQQVRDSGSARRALQFYDYTIFYKRFLETVRCLSESEDTSNWTLTLGKNKEVLSIKDLVHLLLMKLAESLNGPEVLQETEDNNGIVEFIVCPQVGQRLAVESNGKCLWRDEWLQIVTKFAQKIIQEDDKLLVSLRSLMLIFLVMLNHSGQWTMEWGNVIQLLRLLMVSIDNRKGFFEVIDLENGEYDEDWYLDEMEPTPEAKVNLDFFAHRKKIFKELRIALNNMNLNDWMDKFSVSKWNLLYPLLSNITEMEPVRASVHFKFLPALWKNKEFMQALSIHVLQKKVNCFEELSVFCWLLRQLMNILYDGDFLNGIPMDKDELLQLIQLLKNSYSDIILSDKDVSDRLENYFKTEFAQTLMVLHDRNTRLNIFPEEVFISAKLALVLASAQHGLKFENFCEPFSRIEKLSLFNQRLLRVLNEFPFCLGFDDRLSVWHGLLKKDLKDAERDLVFDLYHRRKGIKIRRKYIYDDTFANFSPEKIPDLRSRVQIRLKNEVGVSEAGIDGGGLFREFLMEATRAGVDPNRGLFREDAENRIYPNPVSKKIFDNYTAHFFLMGRLVGKALYSRILLELPLAPFFMQFCASGSVTSAVDFLAMLDPDLHRHLLGLRNFTEDWTELGLDFTVTSVELGVTEVTELKPGGRNISVNKDNVNEYINLMSDFKINREIMEECRWFRKGLLNVVPVLGIFSWKEMPAIISGSDKPINVEDWKMNTNYGGKYTENHVVIRMFWQVVENFEEEQLQKLLKFVTSCSRPPLLGFKDLVPNFGISSAGKEDRLPTASTCLNFLKLPEFTDMDILRERLLYSINAQAGFELS